MKANSVPVLVLLCFMDLWLTSCAAECEQKVYSPGALKISIFSRRNQTGKWVTEFYAHKDDSDVDKENDLTVDLSHCVADCGGKRTLIIRGKIVDTDPFIGDSGEECPEVIRFHPKTGINAALSNSGRSVEKIIAAETAHGLAFTNRPLKDDELFEVTLDKKITGFEHSLGIGASPYSPADITMEKHISDLQPPSWSMYYGDLYYNKNVVKKNYGLNLDTVEVGDRVGIMRRSNGNLHYFVNGADQGPAVMDVPTKIYGVIELYANAAKATVLRKC